MKFIKDDVGKDDADDAGDVVRSSVLLEQQYESLMDRLRELPENAPVEERVELLVQAAAVKVDLEQGKEAWDLAKAAFDEAMQAEDWQGAAMACNILFQADQEDSLVALGQGIWLGVTFPIDPELTVALLQHVVDETPEDSDGAAVAAVAAHYIADLRAEGKARDELLFFTNNLIGTVARRHGDVDTQEQFDFWFQKLELEDPSKFLVRLRNIVDVLVQENWWFDRDALQASLPVN
jgi:hypothetical protein